MIAFLQQLRWQFILLQKNSIITISVVVTLIYGAVLFLLRGVGGLDKVLVALILNDPSIIGYFFIALAVYTERKGRILSAIFVTPVNLHHYLLSKTIALTFIGVGCSLGLALFVKGTSFAIGMFIAGVFGICVLSALLGIAVLTLSDEFLKFTLLSIPVFLILINLPLLHYLGGADLGWVIYLLPIQGSLELMAASMDASAAHPWWAYGALVFWIPVFYLPAYRLFHDKLIHR